jgi:hypothetical protein
VLLDCIAHTTTVSIATPETVPFEVCGANRQKLVQNRMPPAAIDAIYENQNSFRSRDNR